MVTSKRAKLIYICWTGPEVKIMVKTRTMGQKAKVQAHFTVGILGGTDDVLCRLNMCEQIGLS